MVLGMSFTAVLEALRVEITLCVGLYLEFVYDEKNPKSQHYPLSNVKHKLNSTGLLLYNSSESRGFIGGSPTCSTVFHAMWVVHTLKSNKSL